MQSPAQPSALVLKLLAQRESWVELEPGKRVRIRRPAEAQLPRFRAGLTPELLAGVVVGWEGFSEADLLGAAVGSSDPLPFAPDLWATVAEDRVEYLQKIADALTAAITAHIEARGLAEKN